MRNYLIRRILLIIPTLLLVSLIVFLTIRLIPGKVVDLLVAQHPQGGGPGSQVDTKAIEHMLGLDLPVQVQYWNWLSGMFHGNFGQSLWSNRKLSDEIGARIPVTFELGPHGFHHCADYRHPHWRLLGYPTRQHWGFFRTQFFYPRAFCSRLLASDGGNRIPINLVGMVAANDVHQIR